MKLTPRIVLIAVSLTSCNQIKLDPNSEIYLMAGQSNMAGRADITEADTNTSDRIIFLDENDKWRIAKEPLHRLEKLRGLDCGISFAKERLKLLPPGSQIALVPCAVGGSSIKQWLYDSLYRNNKLYSNILRKSKLAPKIDGVLWMQGENDANDAMHAEFPLYAVPFFDQLRSNLNCPIHVALLPSFQGPYSDSINNHLKKIPGLNLINTSDLNHKGDTLHFDSNSQRILGARFAESVQHTLSDIK